MTNQVNTNSTKEKLKNKAASKNQVQNQNQNQPVQQGMTFKEYLDSPNVKGRFEEVLKNKTPQFMTSILNLYNSDLKDVQPSSIIKSAMVAATLDLPIDKNFGYAWIIAYNDKNVGGKVAQFQMGYKGYIQLALRTGQYKKINVIPVYEGEVTTWNALTEEFVYEPENRVSDAVIGYAAYFSLLNGFIKTVYWTKEQVEKHRIKHNKAQDKQSMNKVWREDYDAMAMKTVLTSLLKKWGILSIELQSAIIAEEEPERKEINPEFADTEYDNEPADDDYSDQAAGQ